MIGKFKRTRNKPKSVEVVEEYGYLWVYLDSRLDWKCNTDAVYKKWKNRLYLLRKLKFFSVCSKMLHIFYKSVVESSVYFAASVGAAASEPETERNWTNW